ncbi:MAG TPA: hypothetical protein VFG69_00020 [Nannocystaceae bacterium]|nr:hypothetical protein [Nannocystaceae bacterium]
MTRTVHVGDGVAWLRGHALAPEAAIVTSMPDHSEVPALGVDGWKRWFVETAALACSRVADEAVAVFFQSDVKHDGRWIDKGHLVHTGADAAGSHLLFHKAVCRKPVGTATYGRPAWAHLLAFSRALRLDPGVATLDVLPQLGKMPWARAMGTDVCAFVCRFLLAQTACRTVIDPFCGVGTMLAVANMHGLDAVGVELSAKRAARARALVLPPGE